MKHTILILCLVASVIALAGCRTLETLGSEVGEFLPATQGDVSDLRHEGKAAEDAIRSDVLAAREAGGAAAAEVAILRDGQERANADFAKRVEDASGMPWWLMTILGLLGVSVPGGIAVQKRRARKVVAEFDAKPFEGSNGVTLSEGTLVDAALKFLAGANKA